MEHLATYIVAGRPFQVWRTPGGRFLVADADNPNLENPILEFRHSLPTRSEVAAELEPLLVAGQLPQPPAARLLDVLAVPRRLVLGAAAAWRACRVVSPGLAAEIGVDLERLAGVTVGVDGDHAFARLGPDLQSGAAEFEPLTPDPASAESRALLQLWRTLDGRPRAVFDVTESADPPRESV